MNRIQRLRRSVQVVSTAGRIYLGYRRVGWRNRWRSPKDAERRMSEYHRRSAQRILDAAISLQGLLIKMGQMMGARADIFPDEYIEVLSQLHDTVPPRTYEVISRVIDEELGAG